MTRTYRFRGHEYRQAADVTRDTEAQRYAVELYERFIRLISTKAGVTKLKPYPGKLYRRFERGLFVPGTELDPGFTDLDVIVAHQPEGTETATAGGYVDRDPQTGRYQLALVDADVWADDYELPLDPKRARVRFPRGTFVHELMHYLDIARRWKGQQNPFDLETEEERRRQEEEEEQRGESGDGPEADYWKDPLEFNAFFQEGAQQINVTFEQAVRRKAARRNRDLEWFTRPFEQFVRRARAYFRSEWLQRMGGRRERAFYKRLYGLYRALRQRAEQILHRSRVEPSEVRRLFGPGLGSRQLPRAPRPTVYSSNVRLAAMDQDTIKLHFTPHQMYILKTAWAPELDSAGESPVYQRSRWGKTFISGPQEFWDETLGSLDHYRETQLYNDIQHVLDRSEYHQDAGDYDEQLLTTHQRFAIQRIQRSYDILVTKIEQALAEPEAAPAPPPDIQLAAPRVDWRPGQKTLVGLMPNGRPVYLLPDYDDELARYRFDTFLSAWRAWLEQRRPAELQRILQNPQTDIERQFVRLVKKP